MHLSRRASFPTLDDGAARAAARGVQVRLLVSDWCKRRRLASRGCSGSRGSPNVEVRVITIPPWSGGYIPFARVAHAKYLVVDGEHAWVGTSNWEGDYFIKSRNVGVIVDGGALPRRLDSFFVDDWKSNYVQRVDPAASYVAPRTH